MSSDTHESICVYGAGILVKHLQALAGEVEGVRAGSEDIEFIHRARVASRRLRSAFPLFGDCLPPKKKKGWLKQIKTVTQSLGAARDADVQLEALQDFSKDVTGLRALPGLRRLTLRLKQQRESVQPGVNSSMQALIESRVIEAMIERMQPVAARQERVYLYTPALYQHAFNAIAARLDALLSFDPIVSQPEKVKELHEMRIAAKWLRYTMENCSTLYASGLKEDIQRTKQVQEALGNIHDCDVWIEFLPRFLAEEHQKTVDFFGSARSYSRIVPGVNLFLQDRVDARRKVYEQFVIDWAAWKEQNAWGDLRERIKAPFFKSAPEEPPAPGARLESGEPISTENTPATDASGEAAQSEQQHGG